MPSVKTKIDNNSDLLSLDKNVYSSDSISKPCHEKQEPELKVNPRKWLQCQNCNYKTQRSDNLRKHCETQTKPVQCNLCSYKSCTAFGLVMHKSKDVHNYINSKKYLQCQNCDYKTERKDSLQRHCKTAAQPVQCNLCSYKSCTVSFH